MTDDPFQRLGVSRDEFKSHLLDLAQSPTVSANGRALLVCSAIPASIQEQLLECGAAEGLIQAMTNCIESAEKNIRDTTIEDCAAILQTLADHNREKALAAKPVSQDWMQGTAGCGVLLGAIDAIRALKDKNPREEK